jgi:hypothetical protein
VQFRPLGIILMPVGRIVFPSGYEIAALAERSNVSSVETAHDSQQAAASRQEPDAADRASAGDSVEYSRISRLHLWLIIAGFGMMFLASLLMWTRFGPSMFVELVTAVQSCL